MTQFRPWSGVLGMVNTFSVDHRVLVLPAESDLPHRELPLPLTHCCGWTATFGICGVITRVWRDENCIRASGVIDVDVDGAMEIRLRNRIPQPVGLQVIGGEVEHHEGSWGPAVRGGPVVAVHQDWTISCAAVVDQAAWPEAFITLDDEVPRFRRSHPYSSVT